MFKDWDEVPEYLRKKIEALVKVKWINGYPDGTIRIKEPVDGERLINALYAVLERFEEAEEHDRIQLAQQIANYVVGVKAYIGTKSGEGAGVVIAPGKVLTAAHVVNGASRVDVAWTSPHADPSLPATWVGPVRIIKLNADYDLALLDVPAATHVAQLAEELVNADFKTVDKQWSGRKVYIVGSPLGNKGALSDGLYNGHTMRYDGIHLLLTEAGINPGNSGGPAFDLEGRLVGIVSAKPVVNVQTGETADDLALLVPPLVIKHFLDEK